MTTSTPGIFGTSINTLDPFLGALTDPQAILAQWVDLTLRTRLGFYWSAPENGADLAGYVLQGLTADAFAAIPATVETTLAADQRIASVVVTGTPTYTAVGAVALALAIVVTPKDPSLAPFSLAAVASADVVSLVTRGIAAT